MTEVPEEVQAEPISPTARLFGLLWAGTVLLTTFTFWQDPLFLNLASSFRVHLVLALLVLSLPPTLLFTGKRRLLFYSVTALFGFTFASYYIPAPQVAGSELHLAVANVHSSNRDLSRLSGWVRENPPAVLGVLEVAPHHISTLESLGYENVLLEPRQGNFGLALLCRTAPLKAEILEADSHFPTILAEFENYRLLLTHPVPPISTEAREIGDDQVSRLAKLLASSEKPVVVMGDLNATGWDLRTQPFLELGLRDCRKGFGIIATWPVQRSLMQIPIDHILVPQEWGVSACQRGPDIGSDHYPLTATVTVPSPR